MEWRVDYRKDDETRCIALPDLPNALQAACRLLDQGCDVIRIAADESTSLSANEIRKIYAIWTDTTSRMGALRKSRTDNEFPGGK